MGSGRRSVFARLRGRSPIYLAQYAALRLSARVDAHQLEFPLLPRDIADSDALRPTSETGWSIQRSPRVAWLGFPPNAGSGGHTTQFRMMAACIAAGQETTLLLYDRYGGDFQRRIDIVRQAWPWMTADIQPIPEEITGFDAVVATSWPTAHVLARRGAQGRRLYFIQDYEPYFVAHGAESALIEDSYRFGFRHMALGHMVQDVLREEARVDSDYVPFGCDTDTYHLESTPRPRSGIVFYAKRNNDRRGFTLAMRALSLFHAACPDETIHMYGDVIDDAPFPTVQHGNLDPHALNALYNASVAGLTLSFTNISLVPEELLAAGAVPVMNDFEPARTNLPNPFAVWARATPTSLANALVTVTRRPDRDEHALRAGASMIGRSWKEAEAATIRIISDELSMSSGGHPRTTVRGS